jgi:2'-5' RNA ligase
VGRARSHPPEGPSLRLFVAVDVPERVKTKLLATLKPFRDRIPGARWTNPTGWHVTLKFLGATRPGVLDPVREAVEATAAASTTFESRLTRLGAFPTPGRARVVWAGLDDPGERFAAMVGMLDHLLSDYFVAETRAFTPHLTVARLTPPRAIREFAPDLLDTAVSSTRFRVDRLVLYRSFLSPAGARYEPQLSAALATP